MTTLERRTITLIKKIYENHPTGGALHIVLDDGNFEDTNIWWCLSEPIEKIQDPEEKALFIECAENLLKMKMCRRFYCNRKADEEIV